MFKKGSKGLFNDHGLNKPSGMCKRSYNVKYQKCSIGQEIMYTEKCSPPFYFCSYLTCCQNANLRLKNSRIPISYIIYLKTQ